MVLWIVNWRRNVLVSLLFLLVLGGFSSQTEQLCTGWWIEQQRSGGCGLEVVRRPLVVPAWYGRFEALLHYLRVMARDDLIIRAMLFLLTISGAVWIWVLRWVIVEMMSKGVEPRRFSWIWEGPLFRASATPEIRVMVSVLPDLRKERSYVQDLKPNATLAPGREIVPESKPALDLIQGSELAPDPIRGQALDDRPVIWGLLPAESVPGEKPEEEQVEWLKAIPAGMNGSHATIAYGREIVPESKPALDQIQGSDPGAGSG